MVKKNLEELNSNNRQGPDEINPRLLKELSRGISKAVSKFVGTRCCTND